MKKFMALMLLAAFVLSFGASAYACGGDGDHKKDGKEAHDEA